MDLRPVLAAAALCWACGVPVDRPAPDEDSLETVTVTAAADSVFRPEEDLKEQRAPAEALHGRLPGAFPAGFPLPGGATVFDFGEAPPAEGEPVAVEFVAVRLPLGAPAAREWLLREAQAVGWRATLGDRAVYRRGEEWVRVAVEPGVSAESSQARFEYAKP